MTTTRGTHFHGGKNFTGSFIESFNENVMKLIICYIATLIIGL